jgi:hypothetical protein
MLNMNRTVEMALKSALLTLELTPDKKTTVTNDDLNQFVNAVKKIVLRKPIVLIVLDA